MFRGYIKEYRKITEWEWYTDIKTCHLFRHCLYKANIEDKNWRGQTVLRGSFITSLEHLSNETGLTIQEVRTALKKLKSTCELTSKTTNRNTVISINNYEMYQESNTQINKQITNNQQTNNKQITTTKEIKEIKEIKKYRERDRKILEKYLLNKKRAKPIDNIDAYIDNIKAGSLERLIKKAQKWQEEVNKKEQEKQEILNLFQNDSSINEEEQEKIREIQKKIRKGMKK